MEYSFSATLTVDDVKRHIPHPFNVPTDTSEIRISLDFEPAGSEGVRNMLTLTLYDSAGFRGAGHRGGNSHEVELSVDQATPGYFPGPLPSGQWTVQIDTHMILPEQACEYRLEISIEQGNRAKATSVEPRQPARFDFVADPAPGWYRGDLHAHTFHSDASWDIPDLAKAAKSYELDFIALTDHNSVSGLWEMEQQAEAGFLTLGGLELTTFWGHAVCLGRHRWVDWRTTRDGNEMAWIAEQIYAHDQIFIIAHPKALGDPYCTGCRWVYPGMMPGPAHFVEVWNGSWWGRDELTRERNEEALALWYGWLNQGYRLVATAGSDAHGPDTWTLDAGQYSWFLLELRSEDNELLAVTNPIFVK